MKLRLPIALLGLLLVAAHALADSDLRPITHEDLWLMPRVGSPALSPDGRRAVVSVQHPAYDSDDAESNLWLIQVNGSKPPRQLTFSTGGESHVTWSPSGEQIAFTARRDGDDATQIHLLDLAAGGEARPVTSISTGARRPVFSPDGQRIAFTSTVHPEAMSDEDSRRIQEEEEAREHHVLTYTGFPIRNWNNWLIERQPRVFVQTIGESEAVDLLAGTDLVAHPGYDGARSAGGSELSPVWAPDGQSVIFVATRNRDRFAFDFTNTDLWQVPAGGGEPQRLTGTDDPAGADNWSGPSFSADGSTLFAVRRPRTEYVFNASRLVAMDWPGMDNEREIVLPEARAVRGYAVTPAGDEVFLLGQDAGMQRVYRASTSGGEAEPAFDQSEGVYSGLVMSTEPDTSTMLASFATARQFAEIVRIDPEAGEHQVLTGFTHDAVAELDLQPVEHFWFESEEGLQIHNMLVRPAGFDASRQYPMLVLMHGGPHSMWTDSPHIRWNYHLLAGSDYVVLLTNFKGSTGFGEDFARAIQGDPLRGPANEINQAADVAIERFGFIDGDRQCAGGASYGGHLANWMQASTDRYRCLISHAGLVNLITQWGTSDAVYHREANLGGPPWEIPEVWLDQNPLMYADRWQTPVLVTIGKKDERVPLSNVLEYWTALQRQQIESRLLVYPDEDHWIMSGPNSRHFYGEVADWLERWLLD